MRGNKPNFVLGGDKPDYATINNKNMKEPENPQFRSKADVMATALRQRKHNFQMSYHDKSAPKNKGFNINVSAQCLIHAACRDGQQL